MSFFTLCHNEGFADSRLEVPAPHHHMLNVGPAGIRSSSLRKRKNLEALMSSSTNDVENPNDPEYRAKHRHEFGRRLLTTLIDDRARRNHPRPFASIPYTSDPKDGYRDISYRLFANAIDRCAWWMKQQISLSDNFEPLIYVGAFDLRYQILANAAVKTGYVMFFISPRNSLDAQLSLIDDAKVTKLLVSSGSAIESMVQPMLDHRPLQKFVVPELEELLATDAEVTPFEFNATFDEYRMKPWIYLHTSGSTSSPKIIPIRHGYPTSFDAYWLSSSESDLIASLGQKRMFIPFPPFHMAGIIVNLACSMFVDATVILPPAAAPLTAELVNDICIIAKVEIANLPPFILIDMVKNPVYLESLRGLKDLAYGGGPLPQETGDEIIGFVRITSFFGSTEACIVPSLVRPREHWKYFQFDVEFGGIEFRPVENTKHLYELVFVRDPNLSLVQAIFVTFPDLDEYHSKDMFSKHPTEPDLWRYEGRLDDMIVLSNAEKFNPVAMEGTISSCPSVKGALVVGSGRFQTALLVEVDHPSEPTQTEERKKLLDSIWSYVETANQQCPSYARVSRELIGFTPTDKPFVRAGKGTIQRGPSLHLYQDEIDELYKHAEEVNSRPVRYMPTNFKNVNETQDFLHRWLREETRLGGVQPEQDFFNSGMDSLDVVNLTRQIRLTGRDISTKQVYNNPSIEQLALLLNDARQGQSDDEDSDNSEKLKHMKQMFKDFKFDATGETHRVQSATERSTLHSRSVVLIGSTGSLGPYLLDGLLLDPDVAKVTCLNRSTDARTRQESKHLALGLATDLGKVVFLKSDLREANLGLTKSDYEGLLQSTTHIIYNAWTVNFNQHVSSFKPLLQGVRNVLEFVYSCTPYKVRLFFMSSVSVADRLRVEQPGNMVEEAPMENWNLAEMGYGQSKLVAESLIADAADRFGIDAAICRLCQLGGPVQKRGEWNRAEWIPSLVQSSKAMGIIPNSLGPIDMVDWLPIDLVADVCLELLFHDASTNETSNDRRLQVWHVVNPNPTLWSRLLPSMISLMPDTVKSVDFGRWVDQLVDRRSLSSTTSVLDHDRVPALKLMPLFRHLRKQALRHPSALPVPAFDTEKTVACSKTLAQAPAVSSAWIELWMKQWET